MVPVPRAWAPSVSGSHSSFLSALIMPAVFVDPSAYPPLFREVGGDGFLLVRVSGPSVGHASRRPAGLGCREVGNRTQDLLIFAKAPQSKAGLGSLGSAVCTGGSAGLRDAFLILGPERGIV